MLFSSESNGYGTNFLLMRRTGVVGAILVAATIGLGLAIYPSALSSEPTTPPAIRLDPGTDVNPVPAKQSPTTDGQGEQGHGQQPDPGTVGDHSPRAAQPAPPPLPCPAGEDTETDEDRDDDCDDEDDADDLDVEGDED